MKIFIKNFKFINKLLFILTFVFCKLDISAAFELIENTKPLVLKLKGVASLPVKITLKNNEVDLSSLIPSLEIIKKSHFNNSTVIEEGIIPIISEKIKNLCRKTPIPNTCEQKANTEVRENIDRIYQELENHILYPDNYFPTSNALRKAFFKKALDFLDSDCLGSCDDLFLTEAIKYSSEEEYSQLYDKIKATDENCQKNILSSLSKNLKDEQFPKKCLQKKHKDHPVCESMSKEIDIIRSRVLEMGERIYGPDFLKTTEAKAFCLDCIEGSNNNDINIFSDLISDINEHSQCSNLNLNQEKTIYSGTGLHSSYKLKKQSGNTYSIPLNLKFTASEDYDGKVPKDQVPEHYMQKVQQCINKANTKMLGPNGEKLKIVIQSPVKQKDDHCKNNESYVQEIKIGSEDHRSHSQKYESDIDCPTITHEVLHLLGLCDEYKEQSRGFFVDTKTGKRVSHTLSSIKDSEALLDNIQYKFQKSFDCRVVITNSIMSNHYERWDNVFNKKENSSLLTPGQFNAILYGSCEQKNKTFNECSMLAYQNSDKNLDCTKQKEKCRTQNINSLNKEEEIKKLTEEIKAIQRTKEGIENSNIKKDTLDVWKESLNEKLKYLTEELTRVKSWP